MAYIKTEQVKSIRDQIKNAYPSYKWSITRRHHSTVVIILQESDLPFDNVHDQINQYWFKESKKINTKTKMVFQHIMEICNSVERCYDRNAGDPYADYGDSSYFIDLEIGQWDKPHKIIDTKYIRHPRAQVGRVLTPDQLKAYSEECEKNRSTLPEIIEIPEPVKTIPKPAGYLPYLNLSIVEEMI
jgi:hypothetical protein